MSKGFGSLQTNLWGKEGNKGRTIYVKRICKEQRERIGLCEECGRGNYLHCHHIDGNFKNNDIFNLKVLCLKCHSEIHTYMKQLPIYKLLLWKDLITEWLRDLNIVGNIRRN